MKIISVIFVLTMSIGILFPTSSQAAWFRSKKTIEKIEKKLSKLPEEGRKKTKAALYTDLGTLLYKRGSFEDATEAFQKALDNTTTQKQRRHIYLYMGKSYESYWKLDKALPAYEKALQEDPKNWKRMRDLGRIYEYVNSHRKAIELYEQAWKKNNKEVTLAYDLGRLWRKLGIYNTAEKYFLETQALGMTKREMADELSYVYEGQGRFQDALLAFEKKLPSDLKANEWARFIYLSLLSTNKTFANQGMDQLSQLNPDEETLPFYESLINISNLSFDEILKLRKMDPTVKELFERIQTK